MDGEKVTIHFDGETIEFTQQPREEIIEELNSRFTMWPDKHVVSDVFIFYPSNEILDMAGVTINSIFGLQESEGRYYILTELYLLIVYYWEYGGLVRIQDPQTTMKQMIKGKSRWWALWYRLTHRRISYDALFKIIEGDSLSYLDDKFKRLKIKFTFSKS